MGACLSLAPNPNNTDSTESSPTKSKLRTRSGSMHLLWANSWRKVIGDRTSDDMKSESEATQCQYTFDKCNCVQRVIFVMNIYKFWNDRKHIVECI